MSKPKHTQEVNVNDDGSWSFSCTCGTLQAGSRFSSGMDFWLNEHRDMHYHEEVGV